MLFGWTRQHSRAMVIGMDDAHLQAALAAWRGVLGGEHVLDGAGGLAAYTENVSALARRVPAVLRPGSTEDVRRVVLIANAQRVPLYPISCGKNWGMGSKLPVRDGTVIVDLRRMNRIRELNAEHHYVVVEPGVTQGQLHDYLREHNLPLMFNVTGSGRGTSLIGNCLERGVGYFSSRADALSGLEVVLGNGRVIVTGNGHIDGSVTTHLYKYGLGPSLDGLFAQSNFGIVTAAGMELLPRHGEQTALLAKISDSRQFAPLVQALTELRKREVLRTAVHIGNRNRTVSTLGPLVQEQLAPSRRGVGAGDLRVEAERMIAAAGFGPWSAVGGIVGGRAEQAAVRREVRRALRGIADVKFLDDASLAIVRRWTARLSGIAAFRRKHIMLRAIEPLMGLARGIPTDQPLKSIYWLVGDAPPAEGEIDPDRSRSGFLYCLPMVPMSGNDARAAVDATEAIFGGHGFEAYITFNMVNTKVLEGVINLAFDRTQPARVEAAHRAIEALQQRFMALGFTPYRLGIQSMPGFLDAQDPFWQTVRELKQVFDPNHIIAPGRYNLV